MTTINDQNDGRSMWSIFHELTGIAVYYCPEAEKLKDSLERSIEAYITERERKAWEAAREGDDYCDHCNECREWKWGNFYTWIKEREK